jgi:Tfp pilus assembly protein PilN
MAAPNQLSFLPDDYLERKAQRRTNAVCAVIFLLVCGGVGSAFTMSERATKRIDEQFSLVEDQYVSEAKRLQQVKDMQVKQKRMAHQADLTASLLERVPRSNILAELTNLLPAGLSLLDVNLDSKVKSKAATVSADAPKTAYEQKKAAKAAASGPPQPTMVEPRNYEVTMKVTGIAYTDVQVAQFLHRLSRSKLFREVNLLISDQFEIDKEKLRKFQIELVLDPNAQIESLKKDAGSTAAVELEENK